MRWIAISVWLVTLIVARSGSLGIEPTTTSMVAEPPDSGAIDIAIGDAGLVIYAPSGDAPDTKSAEDRDPGD